MRHAIPHRLLCLLPLAFMLPGCNSTASHALVVAVSNYEARSTEAIDAVAAIDRKAVERPLQSASQAEKTFAARMLLANPPLDGTARDAAGDPVDLSALVTDRLHRDETPQLAEAVPLREMRCSHARFSEALEPIERAGFFGKKPVAAGAPPFLDILIAQQIELANRIQAPGYVNLTGLKAALISRMEDVRKGGGTVDEKTAAMIALRTEWLGLEAQEAQLKASAVSQLLKAAVTGIALRKQIVDYGKISLSDLVDTANEVKAFITATSGRDLSALDGRVEELRMKIEADPALNATAQAILARIEPPGLKGLGGGSGAAAAPARAAPASSTPCLSGQS